MKETTRRISRTGGVVLRALLALVLALGLAPSVPATAWAEEQEVPPAGAQENIAKATTADGEQRFNSLSDAIEAVSNGGTVTLLKTASGNGVKVAEGKNFTLDLGTFTYTIDGNTVGSTGTETNGFQLLKDSTIKIKNGTIKSDTAKILIQNYSNLTLENVNLVGGKSTQYTLSNNNGNTVIGNGTTITAGKAGPQVAFDVCGFTNTYKSVSVTVDSSAGSIVGKIELSRNDGAAPEGVKLTINGGDLSKASISVADGGDRVDVKKSPSASIAAPEGYRWVDGELKAIQVDSEESQQPAASITGADGVTEYYSTIEAALEQVNAGDTITLNRDVTESVVIDEGVAVTIDLNGCKITNTEGNHTITNNGTLTVKDSAGGGVVDNVTHGKGALVNYGTVTVEGGEFTRSAEAGTSPTENGGNSWYVVDNQETMTFNGGSVTSEGKYSSLIRNLEGTLTINDGTFSNGFIALKNDTDGILKVNGGTITSGDQAVQNWNKAELTGGTFNGSVISWAYDSDTGSTVIGGQAVINGEVRATTYVNSTTKAEVSISGGKVNGQIRKGIYNNGTVIVEAGSDDSTITVIGGTISDAEGNEAALKEFMPTGFVAGVGAGSLSVVPRKELPAGTYITSSKDGEITSKDLQSGLTVSKDEDGNYVVSRPYVPPVVEPSYDVTVGQVENGSVTVDPKAAKEGDEVTVTVKPDEGFELASLVVADEDGNALKLELSADGTYSFEMPAGDVTVHAVFECDGGELCPSHGFTDVDQSQWYHAAIDWAVDNDVLQGVGDGLMLPDGDITRAQMAQVLWNVEGQPAAAEGEGFSDVSEGDWFAGAVAWASQEGIFVGYDGAFDPDAELTREQAAAVLMRWAASNGEDVSGRADLSGFPDADGVSEWAVESVQWAVDAGVLQGVANPDGTTTVSAQGTATRAQVAALMMRLEGQRTA